MPTWLTISLIAYTLFSLFFGCAAWAIVRGGSERRDHDNTVGAAEGAFPADRFRSE